MANPAAAAQAVFKTDAFLNQLKALAPWSRPLVVAVAVASTAVANYPGMSEGVANWNSIASALDGGVKTPAGEIMTASRTYWIADDQTAFVGTLGKFVANIESTRNYYSNIGSMLDEVADGFIVYWFELFVLGPSVVRAMFAARAAAATPAGAPAAAITLQQIGLMVLRFVAALTRTLGTMLAAAAGTAILLTGARGLNQLFFVTPTGKAAIDFTQVKLPSYMENYDDLNKKLTGPGGSGWVEPT